MAVDDETVRHVAQLARITVPEAERGALARDMQRILEWVAHLSEVDTTDVPAMTALVPDGMPRRTDKVTETGGRAELESNAPAVRDGFFTVPKVLE